jgi:hypothetical protein
MATRALSLTDRRADGVSAQPAVRLARSSSTRTSIMTEQSSNLASCGERLVERATRTDALPQRPRRRRRRASIAQHDPLLRFARRQDVVIWPRRPAA